MNIFMYETFKTRLLHFGDIPMMLMFMEHKQGKAPRYVVVEQKRGTKHKIVKTWATSNDAKSDLDILVDEQIMIMGGGNYPLTGYGFTKDGPVAVHKDINIGKFKLRTESEHLPKYGAILDPNRQIEGQTIQEVKDKLDRILS